MFSDVIVAFNLVVLYIPFLFFWRQHMLYYMYNIHVLYADLYRIAASQ